MTKMMLMWGKKNERTISAPLRERERETAAVSDGTVFFLYVSVAQTVSEKKHWCQVNYIMKEGKVVLSWDVSGRPVR